MSAIAPGIHNVTSRFCHIGLHSVVSGLNRSDVPVPISPFAFLGSSTPPRSHSRTGVLISVLYSSTSKPSHCQDRGRVWAFPVLPFCLSRPGSVSSPLVSEFSRLGLLTLLQSPAHIDPTVTTLDFLHLGFISVSLNLARLEASSPISGMSCCGSSMQSLLHANLGSALSLQVPSA